MTANDEGSGGRDAIPHVIGRPMNGLSVTSMKGTRHAILLVSDLDSTELENLSRVVSVPLSRQLEVGLVIDRGSVALLSFPHQPALRSLPSARQGPTLGSSDSSTRP
jgi:hypothetical protein